MDTIEQITAREEELAREWTWILDTRHTVARARAEQGETHAFRLLQAQAVAVGQSRVEMMLKRAELEKQPQPGRDR